MLLTSQYVIDNNRYPTPDNKSKMEKVQEFDNLRSSSLLEAYCNFEARLANLDRISSPDMYLRHVFRVNIPGYERKKRGDDEHIDKSCG